MFLGIDLALDNNEKWSGASSRLSCSLGVSVINTSHGMPSHVHAVIYLSSLFSRYRAAAAGVHQV